MTAPTFRDRWLRMTPEERAALEPSGRTCIEPGCDKPAGTPWGPYWCPDHDDERIERIDRQLAQIARKP